MIQVELSRDAPWPEGDWETLATGAARAAIAGTPHGALLTDPATIEISIRLAADDEVRTLNAQYRHKDKATNVLSFPMIQPDLLETVTQNSDDGEVLLGDIVLAYGICVAEGGREGGVGRASCHAFGGARYAASARLRPSGGRGGRRHGGDRADRARLARHRRPLSRT